MERTIRNLAEEFVNLLLKFLHWLAGKLSEWVSWFNNQLYHRGINGYHPNLYGELRS